jgi:hypothetical protein
MQRFLICIVSNCLVYLFQLTALTARAMRMTSADVASVAPTYANTLYRDDTGRYDTVFAYIYLIVYALFLFSLL